MSIVIPNCYDSHTHFLATGESSLGLQLNEVNKNEEWIKLKPSRQDFREDWLVGFGLKKSLYENQSLISYLDKYFPNMPVYFSAEDGHSGFTNSLGLQKLNDLSLKKNRTELIIEEDQLNTGHFLEKHHFKILNLLPDLKQDQYKKAILQSQSYFHKAGFTFVRDLSMTTTLWSELLQIEEADQLKMKIDSFITVQSEDEIRSFTDFLKKTKLQISKKLEVKGFKIFLDGTLGSETAWISETYLNKNHSGLCLHSKSSLKNMIRLSWQNGYEVAIHVIGDKAVDFAVDTAREVSSEGVLGRLHLEHVQLLRQETIKKIKPLHVICHMQPSHWLSDKNWLNKKISKNLMLNLFRWDDLRKNKIPFYFGSDSPVSPSSLSLTESALKDAQENNIKSNEINWIQAHSYPNPTTIKSETHFLHGQVKKVIFDSEVVFEN